MACPVRLSKNGQTPMALMLPEPVVNMGGSPAPLLQMSHFLTIFFYFSLTLLNNVIYQENKLNLEKDTVSKRCFQASSLVLSAGAVFFN